MTSVVPVNALSFIAPSPPKSTLCVVIGVCVMSAACGFFCFVLSVPLDEFCDLPDFFELTLECDEIDFEILSKFRALIFVE